MGSSSDPKSRRSQLEAVRKQTGRIPIELQDLVELPESMIFVWKYFVDLHNSRSSSGFGINPISYSELKSYYDLHFLDYIEWEFEAIKRLDSVVLENYAKESEKKQQQNNKPKSKSR